MHRSSGWFSDNQDQDLGDFVGLFKNDSNVFARLVLPTPVHRVLSSFFLHFLEYKSVGIQLKLLMVLNV